MRSICVLRLSAIGDVCHAVSAVQSIQRHYPGVPITWVIGKVEAQLLQGLPGVRLVVFDKRQGWRAYTQLRADLRGERFDVLLHMQVAFRANLASAFIRARRKIGFDWGTAKELHALFMRERTPALSQPHVLEGFAQFARAIGVPAQAPRWDMPLTQADRDWARDVLHHSGGQRHLLICAAASAAERNWLPERYAALAQHAVSQGFAVHLCGGPTDAERTLAQTIQAHCPSPLFNRVGQTRLPQLLALIEQASLVLAPDTGPTHMATTVGTPVIGLYGHSNPARTGPYGSPYVVEVYHQHLLAQTGKTADQLRWGTRVKGSNIMDSIEVDTVCAMFDRVVRERGL